MAKGQTGAPVIMRLARRNALIVRHDLMINRPKPRRERPPKPAKPAERRPLRLSADGAG
jgi:hypothetical protein